MKLNIKLTKKQMEVYRAFSCGKYKEILVGGGGGGGKSRGIATIVTATCFSYPGIAWLVGRDNLKKLKQSTRITFIRVWKELGIKKGVHYDINMAEFVIEFYNGSKIFFVDVGRYPSDPFYDRIGSMELTYAWIEEGQEVDSMVSDTLIARYRLKTKQYGIKSCTIITCNPKKGYLYDRFIKNPKPHRIFIPILYYDNTSKDFDAEQYKENILASGNKVQIERLLNGNREYDETPGKLYVYDDIQNMRHNPITNGKKYITIDGATQGDDLAVLMVWDGREVKEIFTREKSKTTQISQKAKELCKKYGIKISHIANDHVGVGAGISYELGKVYQYASNSKPIVKKDEPKPFNSLRDQCFFEIQKHIHEIYIPETKRKEQIIEELDVMCEIDIDKLGPKKVIKKEKIKESIGRSPNFADCLSMRMVFEMKKGSSFIMG